MKAWECSSASDREDSPGPCVVYARTRSRAKSVAYNHGLEDVDYTEIRCRRKPIMDGSGFVMETALEGMFGDDGVWRHWSDTVR